MKPLSISSLAFGFFFVMGATITFASENGGKPKGKPFVEIQGQFVEVEGQLKSLSDQMDDMVGQVESLEERVFANEGAVAALQLENQSIQVQIASLIEESGQNSESVILALEEIYALQGQLDLLDPLSVEEIETIKFDISALQDFVASNTAGLQTLIEQLENNNNLINQFQQNINSINSQLAQKQDILSGVCPDSTVLKSFDGLGNIECAAVNATSGVTIEIVQQLFGVNGLQRQYYTYVCGESCHSCGFFQTCCSPVYCQGYSVVPGVASSRVTCSDGTFLASGGYINNNPDSVTITKSSSSGTQEHPGQSWTVEARNNSQTRLDVIATANCVSFGP